MTRGSRLLFFPVVLPLVLSKALAGKMNWQERERLLVRVQPETRVQPEVLFIKRRKRAKHT